MFRTLDITNYHIYQGKGVERLQVFIEVDNLTLEEANEKLETLSLALKEKMVKKWKCLPCSALPEEYNIVTLPYKEI